MLLLKLAAQMRQILQFVPRYKPHELQTLLKEPECVFVHLPPVCESVALCSSIKVSSFAFPVIRLIAAVILKASPSHKVD